MNYKELRSENARLRGLFALLSRADGRTYTEVGVMLGVTPGRARQVIEKSIRSLKTIDKHMKT